MITPDYELAAMKATETLIKYGINSAPVDPIPILKQIPGVLLLSFEEMSQLEGTARNHLKTICGGNNQDAVTTVNLEDGNIRYAVVYNQLLPMHIMHRALARELAHIVLGHDGSKPEEVRSEEAKCFTHHLLCPRPLIHALQAACLRITVELLGNVTGCYDYCLGCMRKIPATHVPPELNKKVRDQFFPYILNFFEFQRQAMLKDGSALADFGTYMDGYEE